MEAPELVAGMVEVRDLGQLAAQAAQAAIPAQAVLAVSEGHAELRVPVAAEVAVLEDLGIAALLALGAVLLAAEG